MICGMKHFVLHIQGCGGAGVPALSYKKVNQTTKRAWNVRVVWRNRFFIFGLCFFREWFVSFKNRSLPCSRVQTGTRCRLVAAPNLHPPKISPKCSEKKVNETIVTQNCSCRFMSNGWKCWNWLACDIVDKWLKHGHGENVSSWQIFEMLKLPPPKKNTFSHSSALANLPPTNASEKLLQIAGDLQIRQIVENAKMGWHAKLMANGWKMDMPKILKLVDMWDCWQIVEMWKWHTKRSLIAAANKFMTRTVGINSMFFHFPIPARQERCSAHPNSSCQPLHAHDVGAVWFLPPKPQTVLAKTYFHPSPIDERSLIVNMSTCDHVVCNKPWLD